SPKAKTWAGLDLNQRRQMPTGLQPVPFGHSGTDPGRRRNLAAPPPRAPAGRGCVGLRPRPIVPVMPSFDVVSQFDLQEVRNAVDQTAREASQRYDFKGTDSRVELSGDTAITLESASEDRLRALYQVLEEKLVKRNVSLKVLEPGTIEEASG